MIAKMRGSSCGSCEVVSPLFSSTAWWAHPILDALASTRAARFSGGLQRSIVLHEPAAGLGPATLAARTLKVPLSSVVASERKPHAQAFFAALTPSMGGGHLFSSLADHACGKGFCACHGQACDLSTDVDLHWPAAETLMVSGPPCQPFSTQRADHHVRGFTGHCKVHTTLGTTEDSLLDVVARTRPGVLIVENTRNWGRQDPITSENPLALFISSLRALTAADDGSELYTGIHVFELTPMPFMQMSRPRPHICSHRRKRRQARAWQY